MVKRTHLFVGASAALGFLGVGCGGEALTDRYEGTYAVADLEINGAARSRTESNDTWYTTREGSNGITQIFTPEPGVDLAEIADAALQAAEADGWAMEPRHETLSGWIGFRPSPDDDLCDNLKVTESRSAEVFVTLGLGSCPLEQ